VQDFNDRFFQARKAWFAERRGDESPMPRESRHEAGVAKEPDVFMPWRLPFEPHALKRYVLDMPEVTWADFAAWSPIDPDKVTSVDFLNTVFAPGERTIVFTEFESQGQFGHVSGQRSSWRLGMRPKVPPVKSPLPTGGPQGVWYLAQPVDGEWHPNPRKLDKVTGAPMMCRRAQESIVAQKHIVFEMDHKETACPCKECAGRNNPGVVSDWMKLLAKLPLPIVAVYSSGGKSLHALCRMNFQTKGHLDLFKKRHGGAFSALGADPKAWSPTQLTRLPQCWRGDRLQKLLYLNPNPDPAGVPIIEEVKNRA
jgi:hypothetical protein